MKTEENFPSTHRKKDQKNLSLSLLHFIYGLKETKRKGKKCELIKIREAKKVSFIFLAMSA